MKYLILAGFLVGFSAVAEPSASPPNVLLIVVDTLRADRVTAVRNDVAVMPNLRTLAQNSWQFERAYTQAAWTKPSVVSILTSLYPDTHHVRFGAPTRHNEQKGNAGVEGIPDGIETAPVYFRKHGYATAAIQTNRNLMGKYGFAQGCDYYDDLAQSTATDVTDSALKRVQDLAEPYFFYVHYIDPHSPYSPPEPYLTAFGPVPDFAPEDTPWLKDQEPFRAYYLDKVMHDLGRRETRRFPELSEQGRARFRFLYDGECHYVDAELRRLLDGILSRSPNTILVVVADHGEEFWEHGSLGHSRTVYEEVAHVPLILSIPGQDPRVVSRPVQTIDILPTLAAATGLFPRQTWQGSSLLNVDLPARPVFTQAFGTHADSDIDKIAVVDGTRKLIQDHGQDSEYYDLESDPGEKFSALATATPRPDVLDRSLDRHKRAVARHPLAAVLPSVSELEPEVAEQLRALGYIGDMPGED